MVGGGTSSTLKPKVKRAKATSSSMLESACCRFIDRHRFEPDGRRREAPRPISIRSV